ncbi:hypothetical protein [Horticoccus sp. 23ND18S-11]|uniref:hypothetical protein n=1 Tax=Horticoccus sp. 23ND18S-11 TaxID=3391832 RepID=UPI0039C9F45B
MAVHPRDKLLVGAAFAVALISAAGFGYLAIRQPGADSVPIARVELSNTPYEAKAPDAPPVKTETWGNPTSQKRGREWIYDTFTPPEIFYNARSKQFTVKPPSSLLDDEAVEAFGVELVAVRPEPFRLQLIGYVGGEGNWRGTFQNVLSGEVFLASAGRRVPNLNVTIKSLDVKAQPIRMGESMSTMQRVATAVIVDEKAGREITLTHRERHFTGTVFAFVAPSGSSATREVRSGDMFKLDDATFRIGQIQTTPPTVEIEKESPSLPQPDRRVLTPREADVPEGPETERAP